ncbi:MAG: YmdB family metallophosphoesterase [Spirochaetaceae bacterium]|jgi:metallophosphoesterase (TIGR00282 family)|nr:YmdB family metallophosphoesterase [Spirochaetaceae bacterium]
MKILYTAEIVGKAGVFCFKKTIANLRKTKEIDFVIAGCDGAANGNGLSYTQAVYLRKLGADVLTTGDCCFYKKDLTEKLDKTYFVLRPANMPPASAGHGSRCYTVGNQKIAVAALMGQFGFNRIHADNPIYFLDSLLEKLRKETPVIIIDFHAVTSAEKNIMFAAAAGRVSAVIGSHTRVQTADETILAGGTAVITDAGRSGSFYSVGGAEIKSRVAEYISGISDWTKEAWDACELQGVIIDIDDEGKAQSIERVRIPVAVPEQKNNVNADLL